MCVTEGAEVLVLESRDMTDLSSTCICAGNYFAVGTDEQEAAGIEDDPDLAFDAIMEWGLCAYGSGHANREEVVRTYVDNSRDAYDLLKSLGIEFPAPIPYDGIEPPRVHTIDPAAMQRALLEGAEQAGATVLLNTEFTDLIVDGNDMVVGVRAKDSSGATIAVKARKGVALATGGMSRCPDLLDECIPGLGGVDALSCEGHTGAGHYALLDIGGAIWGRNAESTVEGVPAREPVVAGHGVIMGTYGAIIVDMDGLRYVDESSAWSGERTRALLAKGKNPECGKYFNWQVWDQGLQDMMGEDDLFTVNESNIDTCIVADSVEELAEKMGAPELPATLAKYNEDMNNGGVDTVIHRTPASTGALAGSLMPLEVPPFYARGGIPVLSYTTTSSFYVNASCEVLNARYQPVGGGRLRAVGELVTRSVTGDKYMTGSSISTCVVLGLVAGRSLAGLEDW